MDRYLRLDDRIKALICVLPRCFVDIHRHPQVRAITKELCADDGFRTDEFRYVDRRLQAMRKKGQIIFANGKWRISEKGD